MCLVSPTVNDSSTTQLLTPREVAARLGVTRRCLQNWRAQGRGPAYLRLTACNIRYRADAIEAWLAELSNQPRDGQGESA